MSIDYKKLAEPFDRKDWEWRVERAGITNNKPWCLVVPYIQNRAIQERLDTVCGANNWKNEFKEWRDGAQLCGISIYDESKGEWVTKWDGAEDTQFQSTKGGLSASMKRAAVQWGIGRHLYEEREAYAECSLERQNGWEKAQTKDKKDVWWNPNDPKLTGKDDPKKDKGKGEPTGTNPQSNPSRTPPAGNEKSTDVAQTCKEIQKIRVALNIGEKPFNAAFKEKYGVDYFEADIATLQKCLTDMKKKNGGKV